MSIMIICDSVSLKLREINDQNKKSGVEVSALPHHDCPAPLSFQAYNVPKIPGIDLLKTTYRKLA